MRRQTVINPEYSRLKDFINNIPERFEHEGISIRKLRNEVKIFHVDGETINVKQYCTPPYFFNRIIYYLFRGSKAMRAYEYALRLLSVDIDTPSPIAYIVDSNSILMGKSYFISIHVPHPRTFYEFSDPALLIEKGSEHEAILEEFGRYTADLHRKGIYHKDYSVTNILFEMVDGKPQFCIIDINRMDFNITSQERLYHNFGRLQISKDAFKVIARTYAEELNLDFEESLDKILKARASFINKHSMKPKSILRKLFKRK